MGQHVAETMERINGADTYGPTAASGTTTTTTPSTSRIPPTTLWDEKWREGHANPVYWENSGWMQWQLKPGKSASEAISRA